MRFAMIWTPVFLGISLICVMGLGSLVHAMATPEEAAYLIHNTDEVVGFMLSKFDNQYVSGICIAGLFAAGMSSLASVMLIVGTAFVQDMWHVLKPMELDRVVPRTRWSILIYCLLLYVVTLYPPAGIVEMTAFSGAVFAASFFPAIFGGLYLRWGTDVGALLSMLTGILSCIVWRFAFRFQYEGLSDIHEVIPAFLLSVIVYVAVSRLTSRRIPDATHLDRLFA